MSRERQYLSIDVAVDEETLTIALNGEADLESAPRIEAAVRDALTVVPAPALIAIDLRELRFIDSSGLQALIAAHELCRADGRELRIVRGPANVQRVFELTGMQKALPFADAAEVNAAEADL